MATHRPCAGRRFCLPSALGGCRAPSHPAVGVALKSGRTTEGAHEVVGGGRGGGAACGAESAGGAMVSPHSRLVWLRLRQLDGELQPL